MKLTVQQRPDDSGFISSWSATFEAPGGTLGRSTDNHLTLPDPKRDICRIQAALRISDDACYLVNLSSMSHVSINGRAVLRDQEVPLAPGDELVIGSYTLKAEDPNAPAIEATAALAGGFATLAAAAQHQPYAEPDPLLESPLLDDASAIPPATQAHSIPVQDATPQMPAPAAATFAADTPAATPAPIEAETVTQAPLVETPAPHPFVNDAPATASPLGGEPPVDPISNDTSNIDVFSDLFGPGTLPVGSVPDVSAHPFDMESAQTRNPEDPLRQLPRGDANVSGPLRDPLDLLGSHDDDSVHNVFSDQTPSTLPSHDPLAPHRLDPVSDTLRTKQDHENDGWAARDHLREYGGYLRPARVQQPATKPEDTGTPRRK